MATDSPATSLELHQDPRTRRREWRFERIGWILLALTILAALAGAFGDGPLARARATSAGGAAIIYDRVVHYGASTVLSLSLPPAAEGDTIAVVSLDRGLLDNADVEHVTPDPLETRASAAILEFHLRRSAATAPLRVDFTLKATAIGTRTMRLGTAAGSVVVHQFVLP